MFHGKWQLLKIKSSKSNKKATQRLNSPTTQPPNPQPFSHPAIRPNLLSTEIYLDMLEYEASIPLLNSIIPMRQCIVYPPAVRVRLKLKITEVQLHIVTLLHNDGPCALCINRVIPGVVWRIYESICKRK